MSIWLTFDQVLFLTNTGRKRMIIERASHLQRADEILCASHLRLCSVGGYAAALEMARWLVPQGHSEAWIFHAWFYIP